MDQSNPFSTIRIDIGFSRTLAGFIVLTHALAIVLVFLLPLAGWIKGILATVILASAIYHFFDKALKCGKSAVAAVELNKAGDWKLVTTSGEKLSARLDRSSFVHPKILVLYFRLSRLRRRSLVLLPEAASPDSLRRLRVRLRHPISDRF